MLENIVAWVLNNYIGEYLENLNTDQLSVALLSGQVELENVPLKKSALRKLDLPVEVKAGLLGKLTLSVPITRLKSEPWVLKLFDFLLFVFYKPGDVFEGTISQLEMIFKAIEPTYLDAKLSEVLVVIGPLTPDHRYDVEAVERVEQQKKEQMLDELEERHKAELLSLLDLPVPVSQDTWWGASLISTVLNNIQLILNNVHIRYEDNLSLPNGLVFNCGVHIQTMTVQTTNAAGKPGFVEPQNGVNVFKKLELKGFSLYWNSNQETIQNIGEARNLRDILAPENPNSAFIIHPCSAELRMERNSSKSPLKGQIPRFKFFLRPNKITMEMSRRQIAELRALNREWARFERARQHRKWRPLTPIGENAKAWWRFAYGRVTDEARRAQSRRSWHFALTRAQHLNAYCRAYRRRLLSLIDDSSMLNVGAEAGASRGSPANSTAPAGGSHEYVAIMKQIERDSQYSYHELHLFRETVFRRIMREKAKERGLDPSTENDQAFEKIDTPVDEIPSVNLDFEKKEEGRGLYGWITSFFTQEKNSMDFSLGMEENEVLESGKLDFHGFKDLPKTFNVKEMEEEILDVLHESWDDSTLLRRDVLLAEIAMQIEHITLRFVDTVVSLKLVLWCAKCSVCFYCYCFYVSTQVTTQKRIFQILEKAEQRRVLALDLTGVSSRVELSPRQHSLFISSAVHDMSVQRLRSGHMPPKDENLRSDFDQSFMFSLTESTKILLAIGRKESVEENPEPVFRCWHVWIKSHTGVFRMLYRRRSPRLVVRHNIEVNFCPVSVMYEENALHGLSTLFADDPNLFANVIYRLLYYLPQVAVELRRRRWSGKAQALREWEAGDPFACLVVQNVSVNYAVIEDYVSKMRLGIGHVDITDLVERTGHPLLTTRGIFPVSVSCFCRQPNN
uniref:Ricin B-type lectin domain-containing protein n=1 Tax=Angiostrongylus cantonensis TaxID=6313 RepID=A0A0K0DCQ1_ANGCA